MDTLLEIKGLSRKFGGLTAVSDVALDVVVGSIHGLIGPNGAGKTTLLNMISGHLTASSGSVSFGGEAITRTTVDRRARLGIRRTFQNLKLFKDMTVLENVMVGLHGQTGCEIWHAILRTGKQKAEEASIAERARSALEFVGLQNLFDAQAGSLPYGTQRLLEIARAIVARPKLLLLDEPAAGLNGAESKRMIGLIHSIRELGATIILVEHHMNVVMSTCDCLTVLNYGKQIAYGTPSDIRAHPEVVKAYLGGGFKQKRELTQKRQAELVHAAS